MVHKICEVISKSGAESRVGKDKTILMSSQSSTPPSTRLEGKASDMGKGLWVPDKERKGGKETNK